MPKVSETLSKQSLDYLRSRSTGVAPESIPKPALPMVEPIQTEQSVVMAQPQDEVTPPAESTKDSTAAGDADPESPSSPVSDSDEKLIWVTYKKNGKADEHGARHFYMVDANGKKRHVSYLDAYEYFGHERKNQGKAPRAQKAEVSAPDTDDTTEPAVLPSTSDSSTLSKGTPDKAVKITKLPYPGRGVTPTTWENWTPEQQGRWLQNSHRPDTVSEATWNGWTPDQQALYLANTSAPQRPDTISEPTWKSWTPDQQSRYLANSSAPVRPDSITEATWNSWNSDQRARYVQNSAVDATGAAVKPPEPLSYQGKHRRLERAARVGGISVRRTANHDGSIKKEYVLSLKKLTAVALIGVMAVGGIISVRRGTESDSHTKAPSTASAPSHRAETVNSAVDHMPSKPDGSKQQEDGKEQATGYTVRRGDRPWNTLQRAGVPAGQIMHDLDAAAKKSGLDYEWHGSGKHRWIEVEGKSDTPSIIQLLGKYIKK